MRAVAHAVGFERPKDGETDLVASRNALEGHRLRRVEQAVEMAIEIGDLALVDAQALPDRVAALHHAVEDRNLRFGARLQGVADPYLDRGVARVGKIGSARQIRSVAQSVPARQGRSMAVERSRRYSAKKVVTEPAGAS